MHMPHSFLGATLKGIYLLAHLFQIEYKVNRRINLKLFTLISCPGFIFWHIRHTCSDKVVFQMYLPQAKLNHNELFFQTHIIAYNK
jgi:hypothetical protein